MSKIDSYSGLEILSSRELERLDMSAIFAYQQRILRYPERTARLQAAAELSLAVMARKNERASPRYQNREVERSARPGWIYLVGGSGVYKIGKSIDIPGRLRAFLQLPFPTRLVHSIPTDDMVWAEACMHRTFAHCRMNGEWFDLSPDDVARICDIESLNPDEGGRV